MFLQVCPVCEHRNPRGSRFCNECGSPLQLRFCPRCHAAEDVMSLECRSCGERLPMLVLTDQSIAPTEFPATPDTIWKTRAPRPAPFEPTIEGIPLQVGSGAGHDLEPGILTSVAASASEVLEPADAAPRAEPTRPAPAEAPMPLTPAVEAEAAPKARAPSVIERLQSTQQKFEFLASKSNTTPPETPRFDATSHTAAPPQPGAAVEPAQAIDADTALLEESESELAVSAEAETLVEASVGPPTYEPPVEITIAETAQIDEIASQLGHGAWRSAISLDAAGATLTPAVIRVEPAQTRRLALRRVGLAAGVVGTIVAVVPFVRFAPRASAPPAQTSAPPASVAASPAHPVEPVGAAGVAAVVPAAAPAAVPTRSATSPADSTAAGASDAPLVDSKENKVEAATQPVLAHADAAAQTTKTPVAQRRAPAARTTADAAVAPASPARRAAIETPRPCTPAIAALGLCTPEPGQEGN
jgi:hypothetical protein